MKIQQIYPNKFSSIKFSSAQNPIESKNSVSEEESFFDKNKTVLLTLGTIAAAGIIYAVFHKRPQKTNVKTGSSINSETIAEPIMHSKPKAETVLSEKSEFEKLYDESIKQKKTYLLDEVKKQGHHFEYNDKGFLISETITDFATCNVEEVFYDLNRLRTKSILTIGDEIQKRQYIYRKGNLFKETVNIYKKEGASGREVLQGREIIFKDGTGRARKINIENDGMDSSFIISKFSEPDKQTKVYRYFDKDGVVRYLTLEKSGTEILTQGWHGGEYCVGNFAINNEGNISEFTYTGYKNLADYKDNKFIYQQQGKLKPCSTGFTENATIHYETRNGDGNLMETGEHLLFDTSKWFPEAGFQIKRELYDSGEKNFELLADLSQQSGEVFVSKFYISDGTKNLIDRRRLKLVDAIKEKTPSRWNESIK